MSEEDKQRIEEEAARVASLDVSLEYEDEPCFIKGYIAGATIEHNHMSELLKKQYNLGYADAIKEEAKLDKKKRNIIVDEVINYLSKEVEYGYFEAYWKNLKRGLESLKSQ